MATLSDLNQFVHQANCERAFGIDELAPDEQAFGAMCTDHAPQQVLVDAVRGDEATCVSLSPMRYGPLAITRNRSIGQGRSPPPGRGRRWPQPPDRGSGRARERGHENPSHAAVNAARWSPSVKR